MREKFGFLVVASFGLLVIACRPDEGARRRDQNENAATVTCTDFGTTYTGFGGTSLIEGRVKANIGADRSRVKPYSALRAEYERVIGVAPTQIDRIGPSFGAAPARFSAEPQASAIQLHAAFRLALDACATYAAGVPELAEAPTSDSAPAMCARMARSFWSRDATKTEVDECAKVALVDAASEPTPSRRWAYTCAALLTSAGFLTY